MARGIITKRPGGGSPTGRIIVTDPLAGGTADDRGATIALTDVGTSVDYTEACSSQEGDVVDFAYDGKEASHLVTTIKGTVITGSYQDNVVVGLGQAVIISGGNLEGKVTVNGGFLAIVNNTFLAGKVESTVGGSYIIMDNQSTIEGKLEMSGPSTLSVKNSTIEGKLSSNGTDYTSVMNCNIQGKLEVLNARVCKCSGNTVQGQTNTPGCTDK
jgi:hypothetical protein